jgi:dTDP-glucose 4,6-dehydratase
MHILVTGGAGFIGSNFIRLILKKYPGYKVSNLDKLTYAGNLENLLEVECCKNYRFLKGDICDAKICQRLIKTCDCIINFAAESHVDRSIVSSQEFIRTNVIGTDVLLSLAKKYKIKRFIQISTDEVYGSISAGEAREEEKLKPSSPYSASKASADLQALAFYKTFRLPVIITRSSNNFGPNQYPEKIIPLFITNIIDGVRLPVYAQGKNIRDWIFVLDNCRAIDLVLHKGKPGEIYNIGAGNYLNNITLARLILKEMGAKQDIIRFVPDRLGHDFRYAINSKKIRNLGFKLKYTFLEQLRLTINWYIVNCKWWKPLKKY